MYCMILHVFCMYAVQRKHFFQILSKFRNSQKWNIEKHTRTMLWRLHRCKGLMNSTIVTQFPLGTGTSNIFYIKEIYLNEYSPKTGDYHENIYNVICVWYTNYTRVCHPVHISHLMEFWVILKIKNYRNDIIIVRL